MSLSIEKVFISVIALIFVSILVIYYRKKWPFLLVGWFWYLGTLIPVIGLVQVGTQAMADRYTYLPSIGITIMIAWGMPSLINIKFRGRKILFSAGMVIVVILSLLTWQQCGYWKNSISLWNHALRMTKDNYEAHRHLANAFSEEGNFHKAVTHYNEAIRIKPDYSDAFFCRGNAYIGLEEYQLAIDDFNKTIALTPAYFEAYNNRGFIHLRLGQYQQALDNYNQAILIKPDYADAWNNRAFVYLTTGNTKSGCYDAKKACAIGECATLKMAWLQGHCH